MSDPSIRPPPLSNGKALSATSRFATTSVTWILSGRLEREGRIRGTQAREAQAELWRFFGMSLVPGYVAVAE
ncbi:hypothetical protein [Corallococcus aberystwythensis]|uniref:hypothetical protein n=1 Tax=Corallococcus aberystwythensis TaxID=2316722 RepID=UPI001FC96C6C|nr:hypothetical protein [Corallococcus aberystwythensis]